MANSYTEYIWNYFKGKIGNEYGVAGLMGNLEAESGMIPNNMENAYEGTYNDITYTNAINNGSYSKAQFTDDWIGYGLAQWTYPSRKEALYEMWKSGNYSGIDDIALQCSYLWYELQTDYVGVLSVLKTASSVREASDKVLHDFENPLVQDEAVERYRASMGQAWYELYTGTGGGGSEGDEPSPGGRKQIPLSKLLLFAIATDR